MGGIVNPEVTELRIRYSEVDRMGLLYHVNHLEYFEVARSNWIRGIWKTYRELEDAGYALVVLEAHLNYHRPAYYDEVLQVRVRPTGWGGSRLTFDYVITRSGEGQPLCTGRTVHCFVGRDGKTRRMPPDLRRILESRYAEVAHTLEKTA